MPLEFDNILMDPFDSAQCIGVAHTLDGMLAGGRLSRNAAGGWGYDSLVTGVQAL